MNRRWTEISKDALFWPRMAAAAVDGGICFLVMGLATVLAFVLADSVYFLPLLLALSAFGLIFPMLYFALFESSQAQATPGKRIAGIVVETVNSERVTLLAAIARSALKLLILGMLAGPISWLLALVATVLMFATLQDVEAARDWAEMFVTCASITIAGTLIVAQSGWTEKRQSFHDVLVGHRVVRSRLPNGGTV